MRLSPHLPFLLLLTLLAALPAQANQAPVDLLLVDKSARQLVLFAAGEPVRSYRIALGRNPVGTKISSGDCRTPEGVYTIDDRNPTSRFHKSLRISYPNPEDRRRAARLGVDPGGEIRIHGLDPEWEWLGPYHAYLDWTEGCIAVTNEEMEEIWALVPPGATIEIRP